MSRKACTLGIIITSIGFMIMLLIFIHQVRIERLKYERDAIIKQITEQPYDNPSYNAGPPMEEGSTYILSPRHGVEEYRYGAPPMEERK